KLPQSFVAQQITTTQKLRRQFSGPSPSKKESEFFRTSHARKRLIAPPHRTRPLTHLAPSELASVEPRFVTRTRQERLSPPTPLAGVEGRFILQSEQSSSLTTAP